MLKYLEERNKWFIKKQVGLLGRKTIISKIKMSLNWFNWRLKAEEEKEKKPSRFEDVAIKIIQKQDTEKKMNRHK